MHSEVIEALSISNFLILRMGKLKPQGGCGRVTQPASGSDHTGTQTPSVLSTFALKGLLSCLHPSIQCVHLIIAHLQLQRRARLGGQPHRLHSEASSGPGFRVIEAHAGSVPAHPWGSPIPGHPVAPSHSQLLPVSFSFFWHPRLSVPLLTVHHLLWEKALCPLPRGLMTK